MSPSQTKTEWQLDRVCERLGVAAPTKDQEGAFAPQSADTRAALLAILADPKAAKDRLDALAAANARHQRMIDAAEKAQANYDAAVAGLANAEAAHEKKLADAKFNHDREVERLRRDVEGLMQAAEAEKKEAAETLAQANKLKAEYERKLAEFHRLAAA